jgi:hypothetical protein
MRDQNEEDADEDAIDIVEVPADIVEKTLFGNLLVHLMTEYEGRIQWLARTDKLSFGSRGSLEIG